MTYDPPFARRTHWDFDANPLIARLDQFRDDKVPVTDLTESNPTRCGFHYPEQKILGSFQNTGNLSYHPSAQGALSARETVAADYSQRGASVDPSRILLTASTSEAYSLVFRLLADPGDTILIPRPSYPLFHLLMDINDVRIGTYPLVYDQGWKVDLEALRQAVDERTRAIVLVNPNNPTGSFIGNNELAQINAVCREKDLCLICDEVFADYRLEEKPDRAGSLAGNGEVLTFVLNGISKSLGLPQMKAGWIALSGPDAQVRAARQRLEVILDTYLSVNTPAQNALPAWLALRDPIQQEINGRLRKNLDLVSRQLEGSPAGLLAPEGGWYAPLRLPEGTDEEGLAMQLLEEDHVFVHPGYLFDFQDFPAAVVSLLTPPEQLEKGIGCLLSRL